MIINKLKTPRFGYGYSQYNYYYRRYYGELDGASSGVNGSLPKRIVEQAKSIFSRSPRSS